MAARRTQIIMAILVPLVATAAMAAAALLSGQWTPSDLAAILKGEPPSGKKAGKKAEIERLEREMARYDKIIEEGKMLGREPEKPPAKPRRELDAIDWPGRKVRALAAEERSSFIRQMQQIIERGGADLKWRAALKLALLDTEPLDPEIESGLASRSGDVRYFTLRSLSLMRRSPLPFKRMQPLSSDPDPEVRIALARTIGDRADGFDDAHRSGTEAGLSAGSGQAGRKGPSEALDLLLALLKDEDGLVRRAAAEAIGRLGDERAAEGLIGALDRPEMSGEEGQIVCSALEMIFSYNVGVELLPPPTSAADREGRIARWKDFFRARHEKMEQVNG